MPRYASYQRSPLAETHAFRGRAPEDTPLPSFESIRALLPAPLWEGHPLAEAAWNRAWKIAFGNLRRPALGSGFVSNFIDPAFNGSLFMWDSCFITMFGRYGRRAFDFQRTLDNFYARQHPDGFICREIQEKDGEDAFDRFDPDATGPNLLPWAEWAHYRQTGDRERLAAVLPPLLAYHRWLRAWRTWPDGSYWATGWACGMDNQPRMPEGKMRGVPRREKMRGVPRREGFAAEHDHGHMSWIDTCLQQELAARCLVEMNTALAGPHDAADMSEEAAFLRRLVNRRMWDRKSGYYFDRLRDGDLNGVKSVAAYWALLAGTARGARQDRLIAHLENPSEFDRPHRVPSLSADHPLYKPGGDYWRGSVWAPANFMVLRGLRAAGRNDLAHTIALNHLRNVLEVFEQTGTFWENYAPESAARGEQSARDFVGWTGLVPIAVLLEFVLGLEPDALRGTLRWDVRLVEAHGVKRYPWGTHGSIDLECGRRQSTSERPVIRARSTVPVTVEVCWESGRDRIRLRPEPEQGE